MKRKLKQNRKIICPVFVTDAKFLKTEAAPVGTCQLWGDSGVIEREADCDVFRLRRDFVANRRGPGPSLHVRLGEFQHQVQVPLFFKFFLWLFLAQFPENKSFGFLSDESCSEGRGKVFSYCYCEWEGQRQGTLLWDTVMLKFAYKSLNFSDVAYNSYPFCAGV